MPSYRFRMQRFAAMMISLFGIGFLLLFTKPLIAPLIFAVLLAFLLKPLVAAYERWTGWPMTSVILTLLTILVPLGVMIALVGAKMTSMVANLEGVSTDIGRGLGRLLRWVASTFQLPKAEVEAWLSANVSTLVNYPAELLTAGLGSSVQLAGSVLLCFIFIFFVLLYRRSFHQFFRYQFTREQRAEADDIFRRIVDMTKEYLQGMLLVMLILAVLNSLGLYLIGVRLALFWGVLGAVLAIVPYVGTTLGGFLPFLYALATFGLAWQPLAVVIFYGTVQSIEGNFITPKVVGNSVEVNPFIAVIALLAGGLFWGVAGMILALPLVAILRIVFSHVDLLLPVSELLSDDIYKRDGVFAEQYDEDRFRLLSFFVDRED
jgi:predicted PurR-regulated permease PerM